MVFWRSVGRLARVAADATLATADLAYKGAKVTAKVVYDHREEIASAATTTVKVAAKVTAKTAQAAYKVTETAARTIYNHREEISGAAVGVAKGTAGALSDVSGHLISKESVNAQLRTIEAQSRKYREFTNKFNGRVLGTGCRNTVLDTLVVGGETLAAYIDSGTVPAQVQKAYEFAYPHAAAIHSFSDQVERLHGKELVGFVSGVKGKLFELQYADYLNDGHLPDGFHATLAISPTNPGWDIAIFGPDGGLRDTIQAKATDSVSYVSNALKEHPQIDVVTTSEVHSHLVMQGFSESVVDSGISDDVLTALVEGAADGTAISMDWMPSVVSLAVIAFSAYNQEGLAAYQKSYQLGQRASKSYLAYLAGGSLAMVTNTWWIGVLGGMGSRLILGAGRQKRERLTQLKQLANSNSVVLRRLERQIA